jgi:hypothetical protein
MTLLFMVACYKYEHNISMDTSIYSCSWALWCCKNISIFFLVLIYYLNTFSIQEYLDLDYYSFSMKHDKYISCMFIIYLQSFTNMHGYL